MSENDAVLRCERSRGAAILTLNRPRARNALSRALRDALAAAFSDLGEDPTVEVVVLTGAGSAFCAGLDLVELAEGSRTDDLADPGWIEAIERFDRPVIAAVNGDAVTGGFELALACDVLLAAPEARFADTHARVGVLPGWGLSQKLSRLIGIHRAKELSLTGNFIDAERAVDWGLVNRIVSAEALLDACLALAGDMMSCETSTLRAYKALIDRGFAERFADGRALEVKRTREHGGVRAAGDIAERTASVMARGRAQKGGGPR